jgi:hypothetical protein
LTADNRAAAVGGLFTTNINSLTIFRLVLIAVVGTAFLVGAYRAVQTKKAVGKVSKICDTELIASQKYSLYGRCGLHETSQRDLVYTAYAGSVVLPLTGPSTGEPASGVILIAKTPCVIAGSK